MRTGTRRKPLPPLFRECGLTSQTQHYKEEQMTPQQFEKQTPRSDEAEVNPHETSRNLENQLNATIKEINASIPERGKNEPLPHYVHLAEKLYDAAVEAAKHQVARAEALVHRIELEADQARQKAKKLQEDCQAMERDLEDLSSEMLQSFGRYNGHKNGGR